MGFKKIMVKIEDHEKLQAQRDALLAAAKDLLEGCRDDSRGPFINIASPKHSERVTAMRKAIKDAEASQ